MQFRLATLTVVLCFGLAAVAAPLPHEAPASPGAPPAPVGALITTTAPAAPVNTPSTSGAPDTAVAPVPTDVAGMEGLLKGVLSNAEPGLAKLTAAVGATDIIGGAIVPLIGELEATVGVAVRALHGVAPIEGDASDALNNAATDVSKIVQSVKEIVGMELLTDNFVEAALAQLDGTVNGLLKTVDSLVNGLLATAATVVNPVVCRLLAGVVPRQLADYV